MKKEVKLSTLGNSHTRANLQRFYPFLRYEFRILNADELKSEKVFHELFPGSEVVDLEFLNAIYQFQQCDTKTKATSTGKDSADSAKA